MQCGISWSMTFFFVSIDPGNATYIISNVILNIVTLMRIKCLLGYGCQSVRLGYFVEIVSFIQVKCCVGHDKTWYPLFEGNEGVGVTLLNIVVYGIILVFALPLILEILDRVSGEFLLVLFSAVMKLKCGLEFLTFWLKTNPWLSEHLFHQMFCFCKYSFENFKWILWLFLLWGIGISGWGW